jgi:hypothetical protein
MYLLCTFRTPGRPPPPKHTHCHPAFPFASPTLSVPPTDPGKRSGSLDGLTWRGEHSPPLQPPVHHRSLRDNASANAAR